MPEFTLTGRADAPRWPGWRPSLRLLQRAEYRSWLISGARSGLVADPYHAFLHYARDQSAIAAEEASGRQSPATRRGW